MDSILTSIKKLLGIDEATTHFDAELTMHINSALMSANMIGVGPLAGFTIADKTATWSDFIGARIDLEAVKLYIFLKVRLLWDPPQMGYLVDSMAQQISELEWKLNVQMETPASECVEEVEEEEEV